MVVVNARLKFVAREWKLPGEDHFFLFSVAFRLRSSGVRKRQMKKCQRENQTELVSWARI